MITILGLALGAAFVLLPLCAAYVYGIGMASRVISATAKMLLRIGLSGLAMYFLLQSGSVWLSLLLALALMAYHALSVCVGARLGVVRFFIPIGVGMLVVVAIVASLLLFANISVGKDFCVRYVVPVAALMSGGMVEPMAKAMATYYMGLRHHNHLYYYLTGNGASRAEALRYLQRRAVEQALAMGTKNISAIGAGVSPVMMWALLMGGRSAVEAAGWQVLVSLGAMASSVMAVVVAVAVARRYVVDGYSRLRDAMPYGEKCDNVTEKNEDANE